MSDTVRYAIALTLIGVVGLAAVMSNRLTERLRVPVPALMLVAAAVAVQVIPQLHEPPERTVERLVTVALLFILFDGGMHIGWKRFRAAAAPIGLVGVLGTFLTAAGGAVLLHVAFGFGWYASLLVATAVAPTDPAIVFSVLGKREIGGRSGTILEGESGANDPVGIALITSLLAVGALSAHAFAQVGLTFVLQMVIGTAVGLVGGKVLLIFIRKVPLPSEALYPIRTLVCVLLLYGVATLAQGSGFLAVFVAGILIGDARAPYKLEIERFHAALASVAEIVAFVVLGLTVHLTTLTKIEVWLPGVALALALTLVIRPVLVGLCLVPARLKRTENAFVLSAGLKGAVPILLGELLRAADVPGADELYGIVVVVVAFSVIVQASLTPTAAKILKLPMKIIEPEPWSLGIRLRDEPEGIHRFTVGRGTPAAGRTMSTIDELGENMWVSFLVRNRQLVHINSDTRLEIGDEVLIQADPRMRSSLTRFFETPDS